MEHLHILYHSNFLNNFPNKTVQWFKSAKYQNPQDTRPKQDWLNNNSVITELLLKETTWISLKTESNIKVNNNITDIHFKLGEELNSPSNSIWNIIFNYKIMHYKLMNLIFSEFYLRF